jgi:hypothetical protein
MPNTRCFYRSNQCYAASLRAVDQPFTGSGSLEKLAAMRRALSLVSSLAAERRFGPRLVAERTSGRFLRGHNGLAILTHEGPQLPEARPVSELIA